MALTPVAGVTRLRALQLGLETTFNTQHAATRRYPWTATPTVNPNWTKTTADTGTLTGSLSVDTSPVPLYGGDTYFFINDTAGAIGTTQLVSQIYGATLTLTNNLDQKRFANGSNSMRAIQGYGRGERVLDFAWT